MEEIKDLGGFFPGRTGFFAGKLHLPLSLSFALADQVF
jgi:hypothetical protein